MSAVLLSILLVFLSQPVLGISLFGKDKADRYEDDHTAWVYPPWEHTWGVVRATETHLDFFTLGKATFRNPQGLAAVRLEATDDPDSHGDDDEITVYGVNSGENAIIYNKSMKSIGLFGYDKATHDILNKPWDIDALPNGLVFVSDAGNRRIVKMRNIDTELVVEGTFGDTGEHKLVLPRGIDVTAGGKVIVADAGADRVVIYDTSGVFIRAIGGFDRPVGLAAVDRQEEYTRPQREYFAVTDSGGQRLRKVDFNGGVLAEQNISDAAGMDGTYAGHVEIDLYHHVVTTDSVNHRLLKFDSNLDLLSSWGREGNGRTRFEGPTGIAIWRRFGQTFIAHSNGAHYLWIGIDLRENPKLELLKNRTLLVSLDLTERAQVTLELVNDDGEVITEYRRMTADGEQKIRWRIDMMRNVIPAGGTEPEAIAPDPLPAGEYTLRIRLRASYSSRKAFEKVMETQIELPPA